MKEPYTEEDIVSSMSEDEVDAVWVAFHGFQEIGIPGEGTTILGLDLGAQFGWAVVRGGDTIRPFNSGWYNTVRTGESEGMSRLRFKRAIIDLVETIKPTAVWFEDPKGRFRGQGGKNIIRQIGILECEMTERGMPYGTVHQSTLKKFATGRGNASKDEMRSSLSSKLGN